MTAASNSESRKRLAKPVDPVEVVARANDANIRLLVLMGGVTKAQFDESYEGIARSIAATSVAALRAEGLLS